MYRSLLCSALVLAACGGNNAPQSAPETCTSAAGPGAYTTIPIWVQDDPDFGISEAVQGMDLWQPKCLKGKMVATETEAVARIYGSHVACVRDDSSGGYVLAVSAPGGKIVVYLECIHDLFPLDSDGHISRLMLKLVLGHELGHESGMWFHVPATCDETKVASDVEKNLVKAGICGKALMNAFIHQDITAITDFDSQAYDMRDASSSTFPHLVEGMPDGCILTYWPPQ
jgi:hypothetical protein